MHEVHNMLDAMKGVAEHLKAINNDEAAQRYLEAISKLTHRNHRPLIPQMMMVDNEHIPDVAELLSTLLCSLELAYGFVLSHPDVPRGPVDGEAPAGESVETATPFNAAPALDGE